jgi:hypothetical protein
MKIGRKSADNLFSLWILSKSYCFTTTVPTVCFQTSSVSPPSAQNGVHNRSLTVKLPKVKQQKSHSKQNPASPALLSPAPLSPALPTPALLSPAPLTPANRSPALSPESGNTTNQDEPAKAVEIKIVRTPSPIFGLPSRLSSSCPCLTEIGFKRFLMSRNWYFRVLNKIL